MGRKRKLARVFEPIERQASGNLPLSLALHENGLYDGRARHTTQASIFNRMPAQLRERQFSLPFVNKFFAMEWVDPQHILVGSKCNKLLLLDISRPKISYRQIPLPRAPPRNFESHHNGWGQCGIHCIATNPCGDLIATGGEDPADCVILRTSDYSHVTTLMGHRDWLFGNAWVTDRHVVTGSRDQSTALWKIDHDGVMDRTSAPTVQEYDYFNTSHMKRKTQGKVREVKYDNDLGLVAALTTDGYVVLQDPGLDLRVVRRLEVSHNPELVAMALRHDLVVSAGLSLVSMSDPRLKDPAARIGELKSPDGSCGVRSVCIKDNVVSFGTGRGKVAFWDLRGRNFLPTKVDCSQFDDHLAAPSPPPQQQQQQRRQPQEYASVVAPSPMGVFRPATHASELASRWLLGGLGGLGGGGNHEAVNEDDGAAAPPGINSMPTPTEGECLVIGDGWIGDDDDSQYYLSRFGPAPAHAVYAHSWSPEGSRLFGVGGPLSFGLSGGYVGLWE